MLTGANAILEVKTASAQALSSGDWGEEKSGDIPKHYWLQVQWYLGICEIERGDVAVLFGGQTYREFRLVFDEPVFRGMVEYATQWWNTHVVAKAPPPPMTASDVLRLFPSDSGESVEASQEIAAAYTEVVELKKTIDAASEAYEKLIDKIKIYMEGASELLIGGKKVATWRQSSASTRLIGRPLPPKSEPRKMSLRSILLSFQVRVGFY